MRAMGECKRGFRQGARASRAGCERGRVVRHHVWRGVMVGRGVMAGRGVMIGRGEMTGRGVRHVRRGAMFGHVERPGARVRRGRVVLVPARETVARARLPAYRALIGLKSAKEDKT